MNFRSSKSASKPASSNTKGGSREAPASQTVKKERPYAATDDRQSINGKKTSEVPTSKPSTAAKNDGFSRSSGKTSPSSGNECTYKMQNAGIGGPMGSGYGCFGSMKNIGGQRHDQSGPPMGMGSMYGGRMGSMYGGRMGSMYGGRMGSMYGSMYGAPMRMGSMYGAPMRMGSMYGAPMRMGSMYGAPMGMGSMYGAPMGMGMGMGMGSMYGGGMGMGMGSMYGAPMGMGMGSMYGAPMGMGMGSMYGGGMPGTVYGNIVRGAARRSSFLARNDLIRAPVSSEAPTGGNTNGSSPPASTVNRVDPRNKPASNGSAPTNTQPSAKPSPPKTEADENPGTKVKAKPPTNSNIHGVVVVTQTSNDPSATLKAKDATTLTAFSTNFVFDEVLTHTNTANSLDSVMLDDLRRHWLAGHNSTLILTGSTGGGEAAVKIAVNFLSDAISEVEREDQKFDIDLSMVAFKNGDEALDLLKTTGASYAKVQLASSPVFGPAIGGVTTKLALNARDCVSAFETGLSKQQSKTELVVAFFVLKQLKKISALENTVYLSSLAVVIAGEEPSHLIGLKDKSNSEPFSLLRYAIGGASASVCLATVSLQKNGQESVKKVLEVVKSMQEVKNTIPRSGNVKHFVEFTRKEIKKQNANAENETSEKKQLIKKAVSRMELMLKDAEDLLSKPMETKAKIY